MSDHTPPYYFEGDTVLKRPVETPNDDGSKNITLGFPVCRVTECTSAEALTEYFNRSDACVNACAGIPTDALEGTDVKALANACQSAEEALVSLIGMYGDSGAGLVVTEIRKAMRPFLKGDTDEA